MIHVTKELYCDGCGTIGAETFTDRCRREFLREQARHKGWRRAKGKDLCPECWQKLIPTPPTPEEL